MATVAALLLLLGAGANLSIDRSPGAASDATSWRLANPSRLCRGQVNYGPSSIRVRQTLGVSCSRAKQLARGAVVYRVNAGFPDKFCNGGYCWSFGESEGIRPGLSAVHFVGRQGDKRISAVQLVS